MIPTYAQIQGMPDSELLAIVADDSQFDHIRDLADTELESRKSD